MLFDLDGTLFDRDAALRELFTAQHRAFRGELGGVPRAGFVQRLLELDDHGQGDKRSLYGALVRELGLPDALGERLRERHEVLQGRCGTLFADALPTLARLAERGVALGLVTNGRTATQASKIARLGLEPWLDVALISEREGLRKPDRRIFELALERLGVSPRQAWHVGDHPAADVAGASAAGLTAVWRYVPYWPAPASASHTLHSLSELLPLLDAE